MKGNLAFVWQGCSQPEIFKHWDDGLRQAVRYLEDDWIVDFYEPWDDIDADIILYWEAPVTAQGANKEHYDKIRRSPGKKIMLFAGGPIKKEWVEGFDLLCLESKINEKECDDIGMPWHHAFGINDKVFKPIETGKKYKACCVGTCASWKRQGMFGEAMGADGVVCGRGQDTDPQPFIDCEKNGCTMFGELDYPDVNNVLNESRVAVNCADLWGGGQRFTLEAMAAGIPVVVMEDSPKNREFVEESGFGMVVYPNKEEIRRAVDYIIEHPEEFNPEKGIRYIKEKWSAKIYAKQIQEAIDKVLK